MFQFDVFLAHNSEDKPLVRIIARELKRRGLKPWLDEEQILPGRSFTKAIQQAISSTKTAAVFIGPEGLGDWQVMELETLTSRFVKAGIPVIPVLLPDVDSIPDDLLFLRQFNWVQFASSIDDTEALDRLEWSIAGQKSTQRAEPKPESKSEDEPEPTAVEITVEFPESTPPEKIREIVRQAALRADGVHRAMGGHGLQIDLVEISSPVRIPEGSKQ